MAKFFKSLGSMFGLGGEEKPKEYDMVRPFLSLKEIPEYKDRIDILANRMAGRGVGIDDRYFDEAVNPYAVKRKQEFNEFTTPTISNAATSRGLGRSTIPINRLALESQKVGTDIAEKLGAMKLSNEELKRNEIQNALNDIGQFGLSEADQQYRRSAFDYDEFKRIMGLREKQEEKNQAGAGRLATLAMTAAGAMGGGSIGGSLMASSIFGSGGTSSMGSGDITQLLGMLRGGSSGGGTARINTGSISLPSTGYRLLS